MRNTILACTLCAGAMAASSLSAQPQASWDWPGPGRVLPTYRAEPSERLPPLLQLDATALLESPPPPPAEPPPQQRPMFSNGWSRDGFGGQPRGWR